VLGEGEETTLKLLKSLKKRQKLRTIDGLAYYSNKKLMVKKQKYIKDIDKLPFPARDMLPLQNYWKAKKSHGPVTSRFTSIVTSRGCPFNCSFCSSTIFWGGVWRKRNVDSVITELRECVERYGIDEFEFEDDNMTLDVERAKMLFRAIIESGLKIRWSTPNGIRSDFVDEEMLLLMKKSGCNHLTFAPESGSKRILREVYGKTIDLEKIKTLVKKSSDLGIKTACFFVVGTPAENQDDRLQTKRYIAELARLGLDEIGVFPCVPYPGTRIRALYDIRGLKEELIIGDIPQWYPNYRSVTKYIRSLYMLFMLNKMVYHPEKLLRSVKNIFSGKQELKMERAIISMVSKFKF
jgi:anaerobic magnesium-protoporphyrin IX monomethyl ester cyclase